MRSTSAARHHGGRLGHLFLASAGLGQGERRFGARELGLCRLKFRLGILDFIDSACPAFCQPSEPGQPTASVGQTRLESGHKRTRLVDLLGPRPGPQFGQHLPPALQFCKRPLPLDRQQPAEQAGNRLGLGHVLSVDDGKVDQPAVNGTAHIAGAGG